MKNFRKFLIILTLIKNLIVGSIVSKSKHKLHFRYKYDGFKRWYYDWDKDHLFKWAFEEDNLEMVSGADELCEKFSNGKQYIEIDIVQSNKKLDFSNNFQEFIRKPLSAGFIDKLCLGTEYIDSKTGEEMWICPVTLFVLGKYPKFLYIQKGL